MKIYTKNGVVFAEAESITDVESLLALAKPKVTTKTTTRKVHKKQYKRKCDICGKEVKGSIGLNVHKARAHVDKETDSTFAGPFLKQPDAHKITVTA